MSGLLVASLGACSLAFDDGDLTHGPGASGAAGAPGGGGGEGGVGGRVSAGQGGSAGAGAGGTGGSGGGTAGVGGAGAGVGGSAGMGGASGSGAGGEGPVVSLDDCVLLLHMDEEVWLPDPGKVKDSSGFENNGTAVNGVTTTPEGKFGGAGEFDLLKDNYVEVPTSESLGAKMSAVTYAAWVYPTADPPADGAGVISKRESFDVNVAFTLFLWEGAVYADINKVRFHSSGGVSLNEWHHLAVVYDGAAKKAGLYVDGALAVLQGDVDEIIDVNPSSVLVGFLPSGGSKFTGRIDEVAIWKRALSEGEVVALSKATQPLLAARLAEAGAAVSCPRLRTLG